MYASIIIYTLVALGSVMSSPVQDEVVPRAIEPRMPNIGDIPFPRYPSHNRHHNDKGNNDKNNNGKDSEFSQHVPLLLTGI
jgi:hypothetical protein